jgi:hypothetical protein
MVPGDVAMKRKAEFSPWVPDLLADEPVPDEPVAEGPDLMPLVDPLDLRAEENEMDDDLDDDFDYDFDDDFEDEFEDESEDEEDDDDAMSEQEEFGELPPESEFSDEDEEVKG